MGEFGLSDAQTQAILEMRLQRLTSLESGKIREEREQTLETIRKLREILGSEQLVLDIISDELRQIKAEGPRRRLVAFVMQERAIPREGMGIDGGGEVTSGTHSPMLDRGIGLGYVPADNAAPGTELTIDVRGKPRRARVVKKPIYKPEEGP